MLRLIPPPLHRAAYIVAHELRRRWWRLAKPRLVGCRVLAYDPYVDAATVAQAWVVVAKLVPGIDHGTRLGVAPQLVPGEQLGEQL